MARLSDVADVRFFVLRTEGQSRIYASLQTPLESGPAISTPQIATGAVAISEKNGHRTQPEWNPKATKVCEQLDRKADLRRVKMLDRKADL